MRRALFGLLTLLATASGCAAGPSEPARIELGEPFKLKVGESARLRVAGLEVGFEAVPEDSRCPKGHQCFWEGDGVVQIWLQAASAERRRANLHTARRESNETTHDAYTIRLLGLEPYPVAERTIEQKDYVATLEVTQS